MEETVFYYHATSSTLDTPQGIEAIKKVIDAAGKAFSVVVVDIDLKINGFFPLIPVADEILLSITTDSFVLRTTGEHIKKLRNQYEMAHGLKIKPNIYYVLNKYDRTMSFPNVSKILGVKPRDVMSVPYVKQLAIARNNKRLDYFAAEMLSNAKDPYMRELYVYLKRIMDRMKNEGGVKT
jgi:hypothetical protein